MNLHEYEVMARQEERHWWYRGLLNAIAVSLDRPDLQLPVRPAILDAGCGTGLILHYFQGRFESSYLGGFDISPEAVSYARQKAPAADVYESDICLPDIHADALDLVVSCDVISSPGVGSAMPGLRALSSRLRRGGLLMLNLPAYNWLYSEHDAAYHHSERYTVTRVRILMENLGLEIARLSYRVSILFPLVVASRLTHLRSAKQAARGQTDDTAHSDLDKSHPDNKLLLSTLLAENAAIARGFRWPFGSSVFVIARKI